MPVSICNFIRNPRAGGKFVIMAPCGGDDGGIIVLSDFSRDFQHSGIVARWEESRKSTLAGEGLRVMGGGWWKFEDTDTLVFYGQSAAYGRFDPRWLRERLSPGMILTEKRIDVR